MNVTDETDVNTSVQPQRAGFVAIMGETNSGKSTLLNALLGKPLAIVSRKINTTRYPVRGILHHDNAQIIFVDTPGISNMKHALTKKIVDTAWQQKDEADCLLLVIDASKGLTHAVHRIIKRSQSFVGKIFIALNKIDLVKRNQLMNLTQMVSEKLPNFCQIFMISALNQDGVNDIPGILASHMPLHPWCYPDDMITDMPLSVMLAEFTREVIYDRIHDELPYRIMVETTEIEQKHGDYRIYQNILVEDSRYRRILLGHKGENIRDISIRARQRITAFLSSLETSVKVHLFLEVVTDRQWQRRSFPHE